MTSKVYDIGSAASLLETTSLTWRTAQALASYSSSGARRLLKLLKLDDTHVLAASQSAGDVHVELVVVEIPTNGTPNPGTPVNVGTPDLYGWDVAVSPDGTKVLYLGGTNASNTLNAKTYTWSGTTLTLDASTTKTLTSTAGEGHTSAKFLTGTRVLATHGKSVTAGYIQMETLTVGSGSVAFDGNEADLVNNSCTSLNIRVSPEITPASSTTAYVTFRATSSGQVKEVLVTDNGSGSAPTAGTAASLVNDSIIWESRFAKLLSSTLSRVFVWMYGDNNGTHTYRKMMTSAAVSGATITAPPTQTNVGNGNGIGCVSIISDTTSEVSFMAGVNAALFDTVVRMGVVFGVVSQSNKCVGLSSPIENSDSFSDAMGAISSDIVALSSTRGVHLYPQASTGYPSVRVFDR